MQTSIRIFGRFILLRARDMAIIFLISLVFLLASCSPSISSPVSTSAIPLSQPVPTYSYRIVHVYPHDPGAFTEGLVFDRGAFFEGTVLEGQSDLRQVDLETGRVIREHKLPDQYFGEGITAYGDFLIQLTYQSHIGFVYDRNTFAQLRDFSYSTEGWGITQDGRRLIMSDGTSVIHFLDPQSFQTTGSISVSDNGVPVVNVNELEYVKGKIYANIWTTNKIAIINPVDGRVSGWIDLTGLLQTQKYSGRVDVLNGIAYDAQSDRLFVTGKWWPYLFEIKLAPE
jgi:glutaminyl-peptide cyclotransferase